MNPADAAPPPAERGATPRPARLVVSILRPLAAMARLLHLNGRSAVIAVPYLWLFVFFLIPFVIVLKISLAEAMIAQPPFSSLLSWAEDGYLTIKLNVSNYLFLLEDNLY